MLPHLWRLLMYPHITRRVTFTPAPRHSGRAALHQAGYATDPRLSAVAAPLFEQPGTSIGFWVLFGVFALGEAAMRIRSLVNRSGTRAGRWSQVMVVIGVVGGMLGGLGLASWQATAISAWQWPLFAAGLVLMATGIFVRQWAIVTLGRFFTGDIRVHAQQTVIDWGPYRWVRHPSYSGLIIFFCGSGLALTNWMSLLVLAALPTAALIVRVRIEEDALAEGLGAAYRLYAAPRKRLFPGVW